MEAQAVSEEEFILDLEEEILTPVCDRISCDNLEISYPQKFLREIHKWNIEEIFKEGYFSQDKRPLDEIILPELCGLDGYSSITYVNSSLSQNKLRLKEIEKKVITRLEPNHVWEQHVKYIFSSMKSRLQDFTVNLEVYYPRSILDSLFYSSLDLSIGNEFIKHIPRYIIKVDFEEETQKYTGRIKWNGTDKTFDELLKTFFQDKPNQLIRQFLEKTIQSFDPDIMKFLGLRYSSDLLVIKADKRDIYQDIIINHDTFKPSYNQKDLYVEDFLVSSSKFIPSLTNFYLRYFKYFNI
jgi:hypothetical protein